MVFPILAASGGMGTHANKKPYQFASGCNTQCLKLMGNHSGAIMRALARMMRFPWCTKCAIM